MNCCNVFAQKLIRSCCEQRSGINDHLLRTGDTVRCESFRSNYFSGSYQTQVNIESHIGKNSRPKVTCELYNKEISDVFQENH